MEKMVQKVAESEEGRKENPENPGFSWWVLLGVVVGFAVLSLVGAAVLVVLLSLG